MKIRLLPQAVEDLKLIQEPLYSTLIWKIQLLKDFPLLGPALYGPFSGYRALYVDMFRIVYRMVSEAHIDVAYIRHCKREIR